MSDSCNQGMETHWAAMFFIPGGDTIIMIDNAKVTENITLSFKKRFLSASRSSLEEITDL